MPDQPFTPQNGGEEPSYFTRLSIALCLQDDGTRPVNPVWPGSDIGFLSPAISYSTFPLVVGQEVTIKIHVNNFGTIDSTSGYLELVYNLYLGLQSQGLVPIQNVPLPTIPAGGSFTAQVKWTPPDTSAIHACVHARVFDTYSLLNYSKRCFNWSPFVNPQAGCRNTILIKIVEDTKSVVLTFPVRNFLEGDISARMLISQIDARERFAIPETRFPLPFVPERITEADEAAAHVASAPDTIVADFGRIRPARPAARERPAFDISGAAIMPVAENGLWPRADVAAELLHERFGFDVEDAIAIPGSFGRDLRAHFQTDIRQARLKSLHKIALRSGEEKMVRIVIPPDQFPQRGRRRRFQIDYQVGLDRPVQQFIHLAH